MTSRLKAFATLTMIVVLVCAVFALITAGNNVAGGSTDGNNVPATGAISTAGANLLVSGMASYAPAIVPPAMADSPGGGGSNTWTTTTARAGAVVQMQIWYAINPTVNASHTFSTVSGNTAYPAISVQAFAGANTTSPFDAENGSNASATSSITTGTILPSANDAVLFACVTLSVTDTPAIAEAGWSSPVGVAFLTSQHFGAWCGYKIQTTATAEGATFTWTNAASSAASIVAFKVSGGAPPATSTCYRSLLGVGCDEALIQLAPFESLPNRGREDLGFKVVGGERHRVGIHKAVDYSAQLPVLSKVGHALP